MWQAHHPAHSHTRQTRTHPPTPVARSSSRTSHACDKHTCSDPRSIRPTPALALGTLRPGSGTFANPQRLPLLCKRPVSEQHPPLEAPLTPLSVPSRYPLGAPPSRNAPALSEQHTLSERHSNRENFLILTHEHVGWSLSVEGVLLDGWAGNAPSQDVISAAVPVVPPRFTPRFTGWPGKYC
jgi:hypothetical protein